MENRKRIKFVDEGQDVLWLDVETCSDTGIGKVTDMNLVSGTLRKIYVGQVVDLSDIHVGFACPLADPMDSFRVWATMYEVDEVEDRNNFYKNLEIITT